MKGNINMNVDPTRNMNPNKNLKTNTMKKNMNAALDPRLQRAATRRVHGNAQAHMR
jgi:hypothetical protein